MANIEKTTTYKRTGYDGRTGRYIVREYTNNVPMYEYKAKVKGNKVTLYPYKRILATETKTRPVEISLFDLRG